MVAVLAQLLDAPYDALGVEATRLRADAERERAIILAVGAFAGGRIEQPVEEEQRQIVDCLPAQILERAQRSRLAGRRHAGHEQDFFGSTAHRTPCLRASSTLIGAEG